MPSPVDGSVWGTVGVFPGARSCGSIPGPTRPRRRSRKSTTSRMPGIRHRAAAISTARASCGSSLASGHIGSFDRRKCKGPLNGPKATGDHCPEGWSLYKYPGPGFEGIGENSAESSYYTWVDQHNTFGLGKDVPMSTANLIDGVRALKDGKMVSLRVPYPLGFYAKGFDGRIDDPKPAGRAGFVDQQRRSHAVADRGRQRHEADGRAFPASPRSAGEVTADDSQIIRPAQSEACIKEHGLSGRVSFGSGGASLGRCTCRYVGAEAFATRDQDDGKKDLHEAE